MLLLIDAGNTRLKWAIARPDCSGPPVRADHWMYAGSVARAEMATLAQAWETLPITQVLISNVAGSALRDALQALLRRMFGHALVVEWFVSQSALAGVRNAYQEPAQLGCDRFASAIGARALFPNQALIVATCGTATTIDAITTDGCFIGGMILPGLGVMATSLALNTAQLPQIQISSQIAAPFADNTTEGIIAGCIAAQAGAIERAIAAHRRHGEVLCILAGGAGEILAPYLAVSCEKIDNLVLTGLYVVATRAAD